MNFTFKSSAPLIYIDAHEDNLCSNIEPGKKVDIILSPSFYWVKEQILPLKYIHEVKKILPSIFEEMVPEGTYSYHAYKSKNKENAFVLIAYSDKEILDALSLKGLKSSQIRHIYLAQCEFDSIETTYKIDENTTLMLKDGIVAEVPRILVPSNDELDVSSLKLSKNKIDLVRFAHIVDTKGMFTLAAFILMLIIMVGVEYGIRSYELSALVEEKESIFEKKHLSSTMFQNEALAKKLKKRFTKQSKLRDTLEIVSKIPLEKENEYISFLQFKAKKLTFNIDVTNASHASKIESYLHTKKIKFTAVLKTKEMKIEVSL